jgi:hypothetical protein
MSTAFFPAPRQTGQESPDETLRPDPPQNAHDSSAISRLADIPLPELPAVITKSFTFKINNQFVFTGTN